MASRHTSTPQPTTTSGASSTSLPISPLTPPRQRTDVWRLSRAPTKWTSSFHTADIFLKLGRMHSPGYPSRWREGTCWCLEAIWRTARRGILHPRRGRVCMLRIICGLMGRIWGRSIMRIGGLISRLIMVSRLKRFRFSCYFYRGVAC